MSVFLFRVELLDNATGKCNDMFTL